MAAAMYGFSKLPSVAGWISWFGINIGMLFLFYETGLKILF